MSNDPAVNAALWNLCAKAQGSSGAPLGLPAPAEGTPPAVSSAPRNPEDYQWLQNALASIESPERQVKRLLGVIERADIAEDDLLTALEELGDLVEDINWATEFALMSGPARTVEVMRSASGSSPGDQRCHPLMATSPLARSALAIVIAHSSQLNESVQQGFADAKWEAVLVPLLESEEDPRAVAAILHACSCLCRAHVPNTVAFIQQGGMATLTSLLRRDDRSVNAGRVSGKAIQRTCFFIAYLAETGVSTEEVIYLLCEHAESSNDLGLQRAVASALLALARKSPSAVSKAAASAMPNRLREWQNLLQVQIVQGEEQDERAHLLMELSNKSG